MRFNMQISGGVIRILLSRIIKKHPVPCRVSLDDFEAEDFFGNDTNCCYPPGML